MSTAAITRRVRRRPISRPVPRRRLSARQAALAQAQAQERAHVIYLADQATIQRLTRRVQQLERTVRACLGARRLTTPQRQELLELLAGVRAPAGPPERA